MSRVCKHCGNDTFKVVNNFFDNEPKQSQDELHGFTRYEQSKIVYMCVQCGTAHTLNGINLEKIENNTIFEQGDN